MTDVTIRPFAEHDLEAIVQISLLAWEPVFRSFEAILGPAIYPVAYPDWRATQKEVVEAACKDAEKQTWVAQGTTGVVGFVVCTFDHRTAVGEVFLLAVHPQHQRQDVGTKLNNVALKAMRERGMKVAVVGTGGDPGHAPARLAYQKAGFTTALPSVWYYQEL